MSSRDWHKALISTTLQGTSNGTWNFQMKFISLVIIAGVGTLIFLFLMSKMRSDTKDLKFAELDPYYFIPTQSSPISKYPLTDPKYTSRGIQYRIGLVADLDRESKSKTIPSEWISYYKTGFLLWDSFKNKIICEWDSEVVLTSSFALANRGMELSELITYEGDVLTFDDHTGIVYKLLNDSVYPWVLLADGNGKANKGFKAEWAAVMNGTLYVGSMGKEWTTADGLFINNNPMWVKSVSKRGVVNHIDWTDQYKALRKSLNVTFPGYVLHESAVWSSIHRKWFFLPRRLSRTIYNEKDDELRGTNVLLSTDNQFADINVVYVGDLVAEQGFSSFKFLPNTNDSVIVALKTEEKDQKTATYITAFRITGQATSIRHGELTYEWSSVQKHLKDIIPGQ